MKKMKNFVITMAVVIGFAGGLLFESVRSGNELRALKAQQAAVQSKESVCEKPDTETLKLKVSLLQDYLNFVLQPSWTMKKQDRIDYVKNMGEKVKQIDEDDLTKKYTATGNAAKADENILEFFNFVLDDVKDGLK